MVQYKRLHCQRIDIYDYKLTTCISCNTIEKLYKVISKLSECSNYFIEEVSFDCEEYTI